MSAEAAASRGARAVLLALAVAFAGGAVWAASRDSLGLPWLEAWTRAHPDPRPISDQEEARLLRTLAEQRRQDALLLLAGLAAGCAALAAWPALGRAAGGPVLAVLAAGSVAVGLGAVVQSVRGQLQGAADGSWSLGDDSLPALAGPHAAELRAARDRTAAGDAVLLVGTNPILHNAAAWTFDGRTLLAVPQDVPADVDAGSLRAFASDKLPAVAAPARRWLLDLGAIERGATAERPILVELEP